MFGAFLHLNEKCDSWKCQQLAIALSPMLFIVDLPSISNQAVSCMCFGEITLEEGVMERGIQPTFSSKMLVSPKLPTLALIEAEVFI